MNIRIEDIRHRCYEDENGCWNWRGAKAFGYGRIKRDNVLYLAHRLAFSAANPQVEIDGLDVCHHCDNRACCNPSHLFVGTRSENMIDCSNKGRLAAQNGKHVTPRHDASWIQTVVSLRRSGMSKRSIASALGWTYPMLQRYERRHRITY